MSHFTELRVHQRGQRFFAALLACALCVATGGAGCETSSPLGTGSPGTAGTSAAGAAGSGANGSGCVASGRPTSTSCAQSNVQQTCQTDTDCTGVSTYQGGGRCIPVNGQMLCSYDTCHSDDDCGARPAVCLCQGQWRVWSAVGPGNACRMGNCRDDSDCPGSVCSPSPAVEGSFYGWVGYFCHTPKDQCHCDADCSAPNGSCDYDPAISAWACANYGGAG